MAQYKYTRYRKAVGCLSVIAVVLGTTAFFVGMYIGQTTIPHTAMTISQPASGAVDTIDFDKLTLDTCNTGDECYIAEAIDFYEKYRAGSEVPVLEPVDCSVETGKQKVACEKANNANAGKPAIYPSVCEPYIFGGKQ